MRVTPNMVNDLNFWRSVIEQLPMPDHIRGTIKSFTFILDNANNLSQIFGHLDEGSYKEALKMKEFIDSSLKEFRHQSNNTYH